jgi:transcriptional regulator with XRE-family HTH domain
MDVMSECIVVAGPISRTITWLDSLEGNQPATVGIVEVPPVSADAGSPKQPLHRLAEVRRREGLTRRVVARRMGVSLREVEEQEQPGRDISLSDLRRWQKALGVPLAELLTEPDGELSASVQLRAQMLLLMKGVRSIQQRSRQAAVQRFAAVMAAQLLDIMPELEETSPWPSVGPRRQKNELGQAFFRRLSVEPPDELEGLEGLEGG